jgi:molybdopterin synthase catalytic subunit
MIEIVSQPIDRDAVIDSVSNPAAGALVTFDGRVRDQARGRQVTSLFYEAYLDMALRQMEKIRSEAIQRWSLVAVGIVHRVGHLEIGESSIFVAVSAAHRKEAFEACHFIIDVIKTRVPIWKKEFYEDGEVWVEGPRA